MTRVTRGRVAHRRRAAILHRARGYRGAHSVLFRQANQQVMKAGQSAYAHRRKRRSAFRSLWITRLQALLQPTHSRAPSLSGAEHTISTEGPTRYSTSYSHFMARLSVHHIKVNRKALAQLGLGDRTLFIGLFRCPGM